MRIQLKGINRQSQIFLKYLISYVLILVVPVLILSFFIHNYLIKAFKEEVIEDTLNSLRKSKYSIDNEMEQLNRTRYQILSVNQNLHSYFSMDPTPIRDIKIRNELKSYIAANLLVDEVILYMSGDQNLYTSRGGYPIEFFTKYIYNYKDWPEEEFIHTIRTIGKNQIRPGETVNDTERIITCIYPPSSINQARTTLLFLLRENKIQDLLESSSEGKNANSIIVDKHDRVIASVVESEYIYSPEFIELIKSMGQKEFRQVAIKNEKFFLFVIESDIQDWSYVTLMPVNSVMGKVWNAQLMFFIGLIFVMVLGSVVIFYSMRINYQPIRQLRINIEKIFKNPAHDLDEIETVREAIDYLSHQNQRLNSEMKNHLGAIKDSLIFSLLKGQIESIDAFNEYGKELGLKFTNPIFQVAIISIHTKDYTNYFGKKMFIELLKKCIPPQIEYYCRDHIESNQYILIFASKEGEEESFRKVLERLKDEAKEEFDILITIGVGNPCRTLELIPRSYIDASTALKYRFIKGNGEVIFIDVIQTQWEHFEVYPQEEIKLLKQFIKQGNTEKIEESIESIRATMKGREIPVFVARGICFDIISEVLQTEGGTITKNKYPDIFLLETFETIEEFLDIIKEICLEICTKIQENKDQSEIDLIDQIMEYIIQNYDDCNFTIQEVADHFGMKISYLSQYFKAQTDRTILEYTTMLKIEKAKHLLLTTNLPLNYVAEEVGYYNVSSFIRRFKQITEVTPGEYRKEVGDQ